MPKKKGKMIRITDEAYDYLVRTFIKKPELKFKGTVISNLIMTFLNTKIQWKENDTFQITEPYLFIDIPTYVKYLKENPQAKIPLIEALREIADATTWRKFGEALEKGEQT